jgi:hypothetical protein
MLELPVQVKVEDHGNLILWEKAKIPLPSFVREQQMRLLKPAFSQIEQSTLWVMQNYF